ncbi:hypothetical protein IFM89_038601 [Coptis chinensis]|uniref:Uncharacterized protein n=1 Tax=Coptis chinensis TaxID=261450 RepID=A0A835LWM9_9MAGN|nr:hypothetical protein IFM89_038601 [Coptis chinensis]
MLQVKDGDLIEFSGGGLRSTNTFMSLVSCQNPIEILGKSRVLEFDLLVVLFFLRTFVD